MEPGELWVIFCPSKLIYRPSLITLTTTKAKRRPPPEPTSKHSSDSLKRIREGSQSRSQSPAKRTRDGQIIEMPSSDGIEQVEGVDEPEELADDGMFSYSALLASANHQMRPSAHCVRLKCRLVRYRNISIGNVHLLKPSL